MQGEEFICMHCNVDLPRTDYHLLKDNPIERMFWGKADCVRATSFLFYHRGSEMKKIIRQMKYTGHKEVCEQMGRIMAAEIAPSDFFNDIDLIMPLPLHPKKLKSRGYNQSEWLAKGVAAVTDIPLETKAVSRTKNIETQTHKTPFERWENVENIFSLQQPEKLESKHVLLIDDVLTTGSTALSCMSAFSQVKGVKISLLTFAVAAQ